MEDGVLVQLEEAEQLELEHLGGGDRNVLDYDYDETEDDDEELMNEGSFLLTNRRRETMSDIEGSDDNAVGGVGARNNRRRPDLRYAIVYALRRFNVAPRSHLKCWLNVAIAPKALTFDSVVSVPEHP